jgi:hypothetical protein
MHVAQTIIGWFIWLLKVLLRSPLTSISESCSKGSFSYSRTSTSHLNLTFDASRRQNKCPLARLSKLQIGSDGTENIKIKNILFILTFLHRKFIATFDLHISYSFHSNFSLLERNQINFINQFQPTAGDEICGNMERNVRK